ncbi:hypothetical protein BH11ACT4_BH11ACT4_19390 [soil metagenome]
MTSPWQRALGSRYDELDARLRDYFGEIPQGRVGRGSGVFEVAGSRKRWLWPVLAILALDGVAFPAWQRDVAFTVTNRRARHGTVQAKRFFDFAERGWVMTDEIGMTSAGLTDRIGRNGLLSATLEPTVVDGALVLRSTGMTFRLGGIRIPLGILSPRLALVERADADRQHVSLRLSLPFVGTVYEYSGRFRYAIEADD